MLGALLTYFSNYFDCLPRDNFIAKLYAFGFDMKVLDFIYDYLTNRKKGEKIDTAYSSWQNILYGVPQELILGAFIT